MKLLIMAGRNIFRHTRRSVITALAISVGLTGMIAMDTLMNGADKMGMRNIVDFETGQLEIFAKGYYREEGAFPLDTVIKDAEPLTAAVTGMPGVKAAVGRLKFAARLSNGVDELPVTGIGIDRERDKTVFQIPSSVVAGAYLDGPDQAMIGADLARDMKAGVGDILTVLVRDRNGTFNAFDLEIRGLIITGHPLLDRNAVLMDLGTAQRLMAMPGWITELCVRTAEAPKRIAAIRAAIQSRIGPGYEIYSWDELNAAIFRIMGLKRFFGFLVGLAVLIIAAVGIINTMLMAVMERVPEIGTLKAMGFSNRSIVMMFLFEGGLIGAIGSLAGTFFGLMISIYLATVGLDFSRQFKNADLNFPMKMIFRGEIELSTVLLVFAFGVAVSVLVTLLPVRRAAKLEPADALRHV
jgi:putative ABC transport system permease protein